MTQLYPERIFGTAIYRSPACTPLPLLIICNMLHLECVKQTMCLLHGETISGKKDESWSWRGKEKLIEITRDSNECNWGIENKNNRKAVKITLKHGTIMKQTYRYLSHTALHFGNPGNGSSLACIFSFRFGIPLLMIHCILAY